MNESQETPLTQIDHVAVVVADIKRALKWYSTSFQCRLVYETAREAMLEFHNTRLVLVLPSETPSHIAFSKENAREFGELRERTGGIWSTFVADPTGNVVEIVGCPPSDGA